MSVSSTSFVDQHGAPHVQEDVSRLNSLAGGLQPSIPMDERIGYANNSYSVGYPQPSYTSPHTPTWLTPYVTCNGHGIIAESVKILKEHMYTMY
jgi:hypothetical protein